MRVLADKASISQAVADDLRSRCNIALVTVPRANARQQPSQAFRHLHAHLRQLIETVNSQLSG